MILKIFANKRSQADSTKALLDESKHKLIQIVQGIMIDSTAAHQSPALGLL